MKTTISSLVLTSFLMTLTSQVWATNAHRLLDQVELASSNSQKKTKAVSKISKDEVNRLFRETIISKNPKEYLSALRKQGDEDALKKLYTFLTNDTHASMIGLTLDDNTSEEALNLLKNKPFFLKAISEGENPREMHRVALLILSGKEPDKRAAIDLLWKAAINKKDYTPAMVDLAKTVISPKDEDIKVALFWLRQAEVLGDATAQEHLEIVTKGIRRFKRAMHRGKKNHQWQQEKLERKIYTTQQRLDIGRKKQAELEEEIELLKQIVDLGYAGDLKALGKTSVKELRELKKKGEEFNKVTHKVAEVKKEVHKELLNKVDVFQRTDGDAKVMEPLKKEKQVSKPKPKKESLSSDEDESTTKISNDAMSDEEKVVKFTSGISSDKESSSKTPSISSSDFENLGRVYNEQQEQNRSKKLTLSDKEQDIASRIYKKDTTLKLNDLQKLFIKSKFFNGQVVIHSTKSGVLIAAHNLRKKKHLTVATHRKHTNKYKGLHPAFLGDLKGILEIFSIEGAL